MKAIYSDIKAGAAFVSTWATAYKSVQGDTHTAAITVLVHLARNGQTNKDKRDDLFHRFYDALTPTDRGSFRVWAANITGIDYVATTPDGMDARKHDGWLTVAGNPAAFRVRTEKDMARNPETKEFLMPMGKDSPFASYKAWRDAFITEENIARIEALPPFFMREQSGNEVETAFRDVNLVKQVEGLLKRAMDKGISPALVAALQIGVDAVRVEYAKVAKNAASSAHQAIRQGQEEEKAGTIVPPVKPAAPRQRKAKAEGGLQAA